MDVLLLGVAAIVLLALTIWIVWKPGSSSGADASNSQEANPMLPQGEKFEDQYTSATADLSAGGVAVTAAHTAEAEASPTERSIASEVATTPPWPADTIRTEGSATGFEPVRRAPLDDAVRSSGPPKKQIGIGAAALLTVAGAISGAWLYSRWQRERNKPLNRLRRRFQ
jgi:hypothetical protein